MATVDILYIVLAVCVVVITVTLVWLSNDLIGLIRSIKRSSDDVEVVTKEIREKVLLVSEALDRAGTAASNIIGLVEDAIESIKTKRDQLAESIGLISGVGEYARRKRAEKKSPPREEEKKEDKEKEEEPEENSPESEEEGEEEVKKSSAPEDTKEEEVATSEPKEESGKAPKPKSKK